jgi:YbbR domain-containing protein
MIRKIIAKNIWLKIASLVLAITLWFFVVMSGHSLIVLNVPVKFINMPQEIEIVDMAKTVRLEIEGQERTLKGINQEDIRVVVDLETAKAGKNLYSLSSEDIILPKRLIVKSISPQTLSLVLEERMHKKVFVKSVIVGLPAKGFSVESIKITPEKVMIEGPKSLVKRIYSVKTEPLDVTGTVENLHFTAFLDMTKPNLRSDIKEIEVNISVIKDK